MILNKNTQFVSTQFKITKVHKNLVSFLNPRFILGFQQNWKRLWLQISWFNPAKVLSTIENVVMSSRFLTGYQNGSSYCSMIPQGGERRLKKIMNLMNVDMLRFSGPVPVMKIQG